MAWPRHARGGVHVLLHASHCVVRDRSLFPLEGGRFQGLWKGHDFFDKLKGGRKCFFFLFFFLVLKSGFYVPNHVFLNDLV